MHNRVGPEASIARDLAGRRARDRAARARSSSRSRSTRRSRCSKGERSVTRGDRRRRASPRGPARRRPRGDSSPRPRARTSTGPASSPLVALARRRGRRAARRAAAPAVGPRGARAAARRRRASRPPSGSGSGSSASARPSSRARCAVDELTVVLSFVFCAGGIGAIAAGLARRRAARGRPTASSTPCCSRARPGWRCSWPPRTSSRCSSASSCSRPALRALRDRDAPRALARVRAEVPDHRLGRLGDAPLRAGAHLRRDRLDRLHGDRARSRRRWWATRCS